MARAVLLDRDGVINVNRDPYVLHPSHVELISGSAEAIALLNRAGLAVVVVTNQACIGRGLMTRADLDGVHRHLDALLREAGARIERYYVCPHTADAGCDCRKPAPGLILQAQQDWCFVPANTWFVGDKLKDVEAARAGDVRAALVRSGVWQGEPEPGPSVAVHGDLLDFVHALLGP